MSNTELTPNQKLLILIKYLLSGQIVLVDDISYVLDDKFNLVCMGIPIGKDVVDIFEPSLKTLSELSESISENEYIWMNARIFLKTV